MKKYFLLAGIITVLVLTLVSVKTEIVSGATTLNLVNKPTGYFENFNFFTATTTTATSTNNTTNDGNFKIAGAKNVTFYFSRGDTNGQGNTGSSKFLVEVSPDGTNFYPYNMLSQNLASTTDGTTVGFVTISAATTTVLTQMKLNGFYSVRCIVYETTDGQHTCKATAEF